jgi:hypothetical protein
LNEAEIDSLEKLNTVSAVTLIDKNHFSIVSSTDVRSEIFDFAVKTKNKILMIKLVERSMEEVFRSLTN